MATEPGGCFHLVARHTAGGACRVTIQGTRTPKDRESWEDVQAMELAPPTTPAQLDVVLTSHAAYRVKLTCLGASANVDLRARVDRTNFSPSEEPDHQDADEAVAQAATAREPDPEFEDWWT